MNALISLPLVRGLSALQRRLVLAKVAEVSRWLDANGVADDTFLRLLVNQREAAAAPPRE